jgi:hypothetical protein
MTSLGGSLWKKKIRNKFGYLTLAGMGSYWKHLHGLARQGYVTKYVTKF